MKKILYSVLLCALLLTACGQNNAGNVDNTSSNQPEQTTEVTTLKVASLIPPMTEILELAKPMLAEEGIELEVLVLSDNVQPNSALWAKEVDANFFQHVPYMEEFNRNNDSELVPV